MLEFSTVLILVVPDNVRSDDDKAVALVLILWDHCLTLAEEVATMWGPLNERIITKVIHLLNRYFTEAVLIYRLYGLYMHLYSWDITHL